MNHLPLKIAVIVFGIDGSLIEQLTDLIRPMELESKAYLQWHTGFLNVMNLAGLGSDYGLATRKGEKTIDSGNKNSYSDNGEDTIDYIEQAHRIVKHCLRIMSAEQLNGLSCGETHVALYLYKNDGSSMKQLAEAMDLGKSRITQIVTSLESKGVVTIARKDNDFRTRLISLTPAYKDEIKSFLDRKNKFIEKSLISVSSNDLITTVRTIHKVLENMESNLNNKNSKVIDENSSNGRESGQN